MKSKMIGLWTIGMAACIFLIALSGCSVTVLVTKYTVPTVKVVNANTHAGVASAVVTLTPLYLQSGSSQGAMTALTGSLGSVSFPDALPGTYTVSATATGYAIASETLEVSGYTGQTVRLVAVAVPTNLSEVTFVGMWKDGWGDVDTYMSYPKTNATAPNFGSSVTTFADAFINYAYYPISGLLNQPNGFIPEMPGTAQRTLIWYGYTPMGSEPVSLNWDSQTGSYPETITVAPSIVDMGVVSNVSVDLNNGVGSPDIYTWYGALEYYIAAKNTTSTPDISGSGFTLYIFQGQTLYGKFRIDENLPTGAVSLARIHLLYQASTSSVILGIYPHRVLVDATQTVAGTSAINGAKTLAGSPSPLFIKVK